MAAISKVPLLDTTRFEPELEAELQAAFTRFLKSGRYILGPEVDGLEAECAAYVRAKHAIGVSSGTDALLVALMALGIGAGDEVICPTFTFFATAGTIWRTGAKPVFVDNSLADFNTTAALIEPKITAKTKAIMPVHLFGQSAEMDPILSLAKAKGIPVVEDAAQAIGSRYKGRDAGTMGEIGCFSFFPSKNLGGFGDGGLVTTNDAEMAEKLRVLRAHGGKPKYYHHTVGGNFRIDALQAALIRPKLRRLDGYTKKRQENADRYTKLLSATGLTAQNKGETSSDARFLLPVALQERHIYNQYTLRVMGGKRDALRNYLKEHGVETEVYYPVPMHLQKCFASLGHKEGDFPAAEQASREALSIPIFPELTTAEQDYVVEQIAAFFNQ